MYFYKIRNILFFVGLIIISFATATEALAVNQLKNISSIKQDGVDAVKFEFSQQLTQEPIIFAVQKPARLSFDFSNIESGKGRFFVDLSQGVFNSAQVIPNGEKIRIILDMKQMAGYQTRIDNNNFIVTVASTIGSVDEKKAILFQTKTTASGVMPLKNIDFRRLGADGGKVVLTLPNEKVDVKVNRKASVLEIYLAKTSLPQGIARKLDVTDFSTPVQTITSSQSGNATLVKLDSIGAWDYNAYQSADQFNIEIYKLQADNLKDSTVATYGGDKMSLNFQDIPIRQLLQVIADFTKFNIITSDDIQGNLTLRLKDVPWDQALDIILESKGLGKRQKGNVIWVAKKEEIFAKELEELKAKSSKRELEALVTQSFQLNYSKAALVASQLGGSGKEGGMKILSDRGSIVAEERTNQVFVTDVPSKLKEVEKLLLKLDIPVRQVLIEARIVEARDSFNRDLGIKLGWSDSKSYGVGGSNLALGNPSGLVNGKIGSSSSVSNSVQNQMVNLPFISDQAAKMAFTIFGSSATRFINLELSALEAEGDGKIISSPKVITADQKVAIIEQGTEIPYIVYAEGKGNTTFKKAQLKLEVTPQITPSGAVILELDITKDAPGDKTPDNQIIIDTKHIQTQVLVDNGGTVVIGGIYEISERNDVNKVPLLGDIPVLGNLFKSQSKSRNKKEMLIFITPKVIMSPN